MNFKYNIKQLNIDCLKEISPPLYFISDKMDIALMDSSDEAGPRSISPERFVYDVLLYEDDAKIELSGAEKIADDESVAVFEKDEKKYTIPEKWKTK